MALIYAPTLESKRLLKATMAFGQRRRREHQCAQLLARRPSNSLYCHVLHDALLLFCCVACVGMLLPVRIAAATGQAIQAGRPYLDFGQEMAFWPAGVK